MSGTSRAFVSSKERIGRLTQTPVVKGSLSTGAVVPYASLDSFPPLAGLIEGGYAIDIYPTLDRVNERVLLGELPPVENAKSQDTAMFGQDKGEDVPLGAGILFRGDRDGSREKIAPGEEANRVLFWHNGTYYGIKKHKAGSDYLIPVDLAQIVAGASVTGGLSKSQPPGENYEVVSASDMAKAMKMFNDLYSFWEFEGVENVMLNTAMAGGPYKLKRETDKIFFTINVYLSFDADWENCVNIPELNVSDREQTKNNYIAAVKAGFMLWKRNYNVEDKVYDNLGYPTIDTAVEIIEKNSGAAVTLYLKAPHVNNVSKSSSSASTWRIDNVGSLKLYQDDRGLPSSKKKYENIAGHEFGHLLGLNDGYRYEGGHTAEIPSNDIMKSVDDQKEIIVTANDIEMAFLAALKNKMQNFHGSDISEAIQGG